MGQILLCQWKIERFIERRIQTVTFANGSKLDPFWPETDLYKNSHWSYGICENVLSRAQSDKNDGWLLKYLSDMA